MNTKKKKMQAISNETLFCVKHLYKQGFFDGEGKTAVEALLRKYQIPDYRFVRICGKEFYNELASQLRLLWPTGEKDGKYPWRDSVENIAKRLETLWNTRDLGDYSVEFCTTVARRYLARFQENTKYMKILKYFILKQSKVVDGNGRVRYVNESVFADMLEGKAAEDAVQNEWDGLVPQFSEGELV